MATANNKRKYIFPAIGILILIILIVAVFYALMFGKKVFQGSVGDVNEIKGSSVQFDLQRVKTLKGISE